MTLYFEKFSGSSYQDEIDRPLPSGIIDVMIGFKKNRASCLTKRFRESHVSMRFKLTDGREFYVSLAVRGRFGFSRSPAFFRQPYIGELPYPWVNDGYGLLVVRIYGADVLKVYESLERLFPDSLSGLQPDISESAMLHPNISPRRGSVGSVEWGDMSERTERFFSSTACMCFEPCCADNTCWSKIFCQTPRHNCTSLTTYLLGQAGVSLDLSCKNTWLSVVSNMFISLSLAYAGRELEEFHRKGPDDSGISLFFAVGIYGVSALFFSLLVMNFVIPQKISRLASCCISNASQLQLTTRISVSTAIILTLSAFIMLAVRHFKSTLPATHSELQEFGVTSLISSFIFLGVFVGQLMGTSVCSFQTCFSTPDSLLKVLDRVQSSPRIAVAINAEAGYQSLPCQEQDEHSPASV